MELLRDWASLSMKDRAAFIRMGVANGYRDVDSIKLVYNEYRNGGYLSTNIYAEGGGTDDSDLVDWLIKEEGFLKTPTNIGDGKITLGSGLTNPKWHKLYQQRGNKWSVEDNRRAVAEEVANRRRWAEKNIPNWNSLPSSSLKALLSYKYNYNFTPENSPKLFKALSDGNLYEAAILMNATSKNPKFKKGLEERRKRELDWFMKDIMESPTKIIVELPAVSTRIDNPFVLLTNNTSIAPLMVPDEDAYVKAHRLTKEEDSYNKAAKLLENVIRFNNIMKLLNIQNNPIPQFIPLFTFPFLNTTLFNVDNTKKSNKFKGGGPFDLLSPSLSFMVNAPEVAKKLKTLGRKIISSEARNAEMYPDNYTFELAYRDARSKGLRTFFWRNRYYNTDYEGIHGKQYEEDVKSGKAAAWEARYPNYTNPELRKEKQEELDTYGITNEQTRNKTFIDKKLKKIRTKGYYFADAYNSLVRGVDYSKKYTEEELNNAFTSMQTGKRKQVAADLIDAYKTFENRYNILADYEKRLKQKYPNFTFNDTSTIPENERKAIKNYIEEIMTPPWEKQKYKDIYDEYAHFYNSLGIFSKNNDLHRDEYNTLLGYPQVNKTLSISPYRTGTIPYYYDQDITGNYDNNVPIGNHLAGSANYYGESQLEGFPEGPIKKYIRKKLKTNNDLPTVDYIVKSKTPLGLYTVSKPKSNNFISIWDKFDIDPFGSGNNKPIITLGKPFEYYTRFYPKGQTPNIDSLYQNFLYTEGLKLPIVKVLGGPLIKAANSFEDGGPTYFGGELPEVTITSPRKWFVGYDENVNPIYTTNYKESQDYLLNQLPLDTRELQRRQWALENVSSNGLTYAGLRGDAKTLANVAEVGIGGAVAPLAIAPIASALAPVAEVLGRPTSSVTKLVSKFVPSASKALPYTEMVDRGINGIVGTLGMYDAAKGWYTGETPWYYAVPQAGLSGLMVADTAPLVASGYKNMYLPWKLSKDLGRPIIQDQSIFPGLIGWGPKLIFKGYHASNEEIFNPDFFYEGWALKTHNAPYGIYIAKGESPKSGFLAKRPYIHQIETTLDKPIVLIGEVNAATKNVIRNLIEREALSLGADGIIFNDIADNQMKHQTILKTLNPDVKLDITSRMPEGSTLTTNSSKLLTIKQYQNVGEAMAGISEQPPLNTVDYTYNPTLNDATIDVFKKMRQKQYQLMLSGDKTFNPTDEYSLINPRDLGTVFPIPDEAKQIILNSTIPRMLAMRPWMSQEELNNRLTELTNTTYTEFPEVTLREAYPNDEFMLSLKGAYNPENDFIKLIEGNDANYVMPHEVRHRIDFHEPLVEAEENFLENAYGEVFRNLPNHTKSLKGYKNMEDEMVTTNLDARTKLIGTLHAKKTDPQLLNKIIDKAKDEDIVKAVREANGYGRAFIEQLEASNQLTPERIKAFREAMKYVGMLSVPVVLLQSAQKQKNISNNK